MSARHTKAAMAMLVFGAVIALLAMGVRWL